MLKYLEQETLCEIFFGIFALAWIRTRHAILPWIYLQIWNVMDPELNLAPYDPASGAYMGEGTQRGCLIALGSFQLLLLMGRKELVMGIYNALTGKEEKED